LFSAAVLPTQLSAIVGAPTFPFLHPADALQPDALCKHQQRGSSFGQLLQHALDAKIEGDVRHAGAAPPALHVLSLRVPALTHGANLWRTSGAGKRDYGWRAAKTQNGLPVRAAFAFAREWR